MQSVLKNLHVATIVTRAQIKHRKGQTPTQVGTYLANEFQTLGPTYIKMGQFISSRNDIFGDEFAASFSCLRDKVQPIEPKEVEQRIADVLKRYPDKLASIDANPLASASIGQVHKATGKNGRPLIVKLRRPNVEKIIQQDLNFLKAMTQFMASLNTNNTSVQVKVLLDDIERFLVQEVDFAREAKNIEAFHKAYHNKPENAGNNNIQGVVVPHVHADMCDHDVIVMEYVPGITIDTYNGDKKQAARKLMNFFMYQLLENGIIHGDPHKGNIRITKKGNIVLYDFGNVIYMGKQDRYVIKELVYMLIVGNKAGIITLLGQLGAEIMDKEAMMEYLDKYMAYIRTIDVNVFKDINDPANRVPIRLSGMLVQLMRVYGILEGICKEMDPNFNYFDLVDDQISSLILDDSFLEYKIQRDMKTMEQRFARAIFDFFG